MVQRVYSTAPAFTRGCVPRESSSLFSPKSIAGTAPNQKLLVSCKLFAARGTNLLAHKVKRRTVRLLKAKLARQGLFMLAL
jgi:hypothetical protein